MKRIYDIIYKDISGRKDSANCKGTVEMIDISE